MSEQKTRKVRSYRHDDSARRSNNPPVGLVTPESDQYTPPTKWQYDSHLSPSMQWAGKAERQSFLVPTVSLHVHERIDPRTIMAAAQSPQADFNSRLPLFDTQGENLSRHDALSFYQHQHGWSNRLIAGDSLMVMNSLLTKEGVGGKVQCVYMDPPYGIKYGSNFQPFVDKKEVKDGKGEDLTAEPEMIKAFRDTWELGIHSYLSYMRDRLLLARELMTDSGSIFVQIGDENVHRVSILMDDIFGAENKVATISFATTSGSSTNRLPQVADYLLWYAKDSKQIKYRQLYEPLTRAEIAEFFSSYSGVELPDGTCRKLTDEERFNPGKFLPKGARMYQRAGLDSQGTGRSEPYEWNGKNFHCPPKRHWSISKEGMDKLAELNRLDSIEKKDSLKWKKYENEVPGRRINNIWPAQMFASEKRYVVETSSKAVMRCMLMTTDPGDLVFDPTCGSGVTAHTAEQWGRRWITCDTSRVALALARQRLMTANYNYYKLVDETRGISAGFQYKSVPKVSASTLAYEQPPQEEILYDQPLKDSKKARVTGPFTVEAVPSPVVRSVDEAAEMDEPAEHDTVMAGVEEARRGETLRVNEWRDELLKTGIRGKGQTRIKFSELSIVPGAYYLHATARTDEKTPKNVAVAFGPEHEPLEQRQVDLALEEALNLVPKPDLVVFSAFTFDPEAAKDIDEKKWPGVQLLKALMNPDMQTADLKKERTSNESFWLIGQPEVLLERLHDDKDQFQVKVRGFDYYNPLTGKIESGGPDRIAIWMLDTNYDGRSLYPKQVFLPLADNEGGWHKLAKDLRAEIDTQKIAAYHSLTSLPFILGEFKRVAVKIVDNRGIESLRILRL